MRLVVLMLLAGAAIAADAPEQLLSVERSKVTVTVALVRGQGDAATLRATFTPATQADPLHLYSKDLPKTGIKGAGRPALIELLADQSAVATGPLSANREPHDLNGFPVYPDGPVELSLPIRLPAGPVGGSADTKIFIMYMACTSSTCLQPVIRTETIKLPTVPRANDPKPTANGVDAAEIRKVVREELATTKAELAEEIAKAGDKTGIAWHRVKTVADVESTIKEAHAKGKSALLDFTGPSCSNCQQMAKTVFRLPDVIAAWNAQVPIEVNTDPPFEELSEWQRKQFGTDARPLYVRVDPDGKNAKWSQFFSPKDQATLAKFLGFLRGGEGLDAGLGANIAEFLILAILGGLFTLVMPCTYPMIPFTVNFFAKQAAGGRRLAPLALFYALGIVLCFTGLGVIVTGVFHGNLVTIAGHPVTNLVFALLFIVLGLSLLGVFFLRLPASVAGSIGGGRGGYLGALVMGLTFAITAFSCTAPFTGSVLAQAVATGTWKGAVLGMAVYSGTIAIPFFILAISPGFLTRLPRAGQWMNEFKVVGGLIEIAAALKFLAICDYAWGWGVVGRTFTVTSWAVIAAMIGIYTLGRIRLHDDAPVTSLGVGRLLTALVFFALALWLASGLCGTNLGVIESWFPGDAAP